MGAAVAAELADRGVRVIGFDRHAPPHTLGSSHGETRIIREAYFEHPVYVPLVQRAFTLWRQLEQTTGSALLLQTGGLMIGASASALVEGALRSAELHRLPHALLTVDEIRERYPALHPDDDMVAVWEPRAGVLFVEAAIAALLDRARAGGAELHQDEAVQRWIADGDALRIVTTQRECRARQLIVSAGAWIADLLPATGKLFSIERQVLHWFAPPRNAVLFDAVRLPIHLWQFDGRRFFYGFPDLGSGVKLGFHHDGEITAADRVRREVAAAEIDTVRAVVRRFIPDADGEPRTSGVCVYTNTPDEHFVIDRHPADPRVVVVSPCSGHGFKFAPVIGEIVADLVQQRTPRFDLALFRWR